MPIPKSLGVFFAALLVAAVICCGEPKPAFAGPNDPSLGGCIICLETADDGTCKNCKLSAQPTVIQPMAAVDLKTSTLLYGLQAVSPGLCYGITYQPGKWYASGANVCLNTSHTSNGNVVFPSGVLQVVRWGAIGLGAMCSEANSAAANKLTCHALLLFGASVPIG